MKNTILKYGIGTGMVIIASFALTTVLDATNSESMKSLEWLGYLIMIAALSLIFVGTKRYRDGALGGVINFKDAFLVAFGIALLASVIYVLAWEANLALTDYAFMDDYAKSVIAETRASGASDAEILKITEKMQKLSVQYQNPLFRLGITFTEIFPIGLIIALISAAILRKT